MQLTRYTDYALRVLLYLGQNGNRLSSISEIAEFHDISRNHLMKVVHNLSKQGFLRSVRGNGGGIALGRPASEINVGNVIRTMESRLEPADCSECILAGACRLRCVLDEALQAFLQVVGKYTLEDLLKRPSPHLM